MKQNQIKGVSGKENFISLFYSKTKLCQKSNDD